MRMLLLQQLLPTVWWKSIMSDFVLESHRESWQDRSSTGAQSQGSVENEPAQKTANHH
jgi:hypothetical protein